ncbi:hypothetical protein K435DRAFT_793558 [Dendrothele bispora CBS 962.96]|uniref:Uncharacterized protein n=1 Tax=Dendrothele bispora (strain CBS 962.96) TaxID=1314807 RepID=A0A4S8MFA8_DENBC|nr:hypothetical protein K435DRAFT_793558 [Dendrothele bispora CBS 962.96]
MFYGLYLSGAVFSAYILASRGIFESRARLTLFGIIITQLLFSTTYALLMLMGYAYPLTITKSIDSSGTMPPKVLTTRSTLAVDFIVRMNFLLSDGIVIWRAWVLFPSGIIAKAVLVFCMLAASICTFLDGGLDAPRKFLDDFQILPHKNHGSTAVSLLTILPLLMTNITATSLIAYKTCKWTILMPLRSHSNKCHISSSSDSDGSPRRIKDKENAYQSRIPLVVRINKNFFGGHSSAFRVRKYTKLRQSVVKY